MLYIQSSIPGIGIKTEGWHVGQISPITNQFVHYVEEVQADGDELNFILHGRSGPKFRHGQVVRFFGDEAKFIVANSLK